MIRLKVTRGLGAAVVVTAAVCVVVVGAGIHVSPGTPGPAPSVFTASPGPYPVDPVTMEPTDVTLRAYVRAHPVPARPGMTVGVVSGNYPVGAWNVPCPRGGRGDVGPAGMCPAWQVTLVTAAGTLIIHCGDAHTACLSKAYPAHAVTLAGEFPIGGDYLYVPGNGQVTATRDVRIIRRFTQPQGGA